jgi:MoxR-like ATPase
VGEVDCLLLEFVLGQRPDDAQKVRAHVLETIASDPGLQQAELVFLGLFGRACRVLEAPAPEVSAAGRGPGRIPRPDPRRRCWHFAAVLALQP